MANYKNAVDKAIKRRGKKWDMKLIRKISEVKKGYLFMVNYDACVPIPAVGFNGNATVTVFKGPQTKNSLLKFKIDTFALSAGRWIARFAFADNGYEFIDEIIIFLRQSKSKKKK